MDATNLQDKLLDIEYLTARLNQFDAIRKKEVRIKVVPSCYDFSKTLYVEFWISNGEREYKRRTLRVSDHLIDCIHPQFIITLGAPMKLIGQKFDAVVNKAIGAAKFNNMRSAIKFAKLRGNL